MARLLRDGRKATVVQITTKVWRRPPLVILYQMQVACIGIHLDKCPTLSCASVGPVVPSDTGEGGVVQSRPHVPLNLHACV